MKRTMMAKTSSRLIAAIGSLRTTPIPPRRSRPIILENVPAEKQE
jgi:hypothetical protein